MKNRIQDGKLGLKETITMTLGFTIGSGVITMTGVAIGMTGKSVIFSYILAMVMFLLAALPSIMMCIVHPTRSASYVYASKLLHPRLGGFYFYIYFLGRLTIAIFGISFAQYLAGVVPGLNQQVVAVGVLTLFYAVNMFGMKSAAKAQNIMSVILVVSLLVYIGGGLAKVDFGNYFSDAKFFHGGLGGFWSASSLLVFAIGGGSILVDFGNTIRDSKRTIPKVILGVTVCVAVVYALLSVVAAGVLPHEKVANQPMTNSAAAVFGSGSPMYILFIIGGALLALTTTLNSSFLWYANSMIKGCEEGWFPKTLTTTNRFGVPWKLMTIFYIFGLIPTLFNLDIMVLSKTAVGLTTFMWLIPVFGLVNMPKRMPDEWKASKFAKVPRWCLWVMAGISFAIYAAQTISLFSTNPPAANIIIICYAAAVGVFVLIKKPGADRTETAETVNKETA